MFLCLRRPFKIHRMQKKNLWAGYMEFFFSVICSVITFWSIWPFFLFLLSPSPCRPGDMRSHLSSCYSFHCIYLSYICLCSPTQRYPGFEYKYIKGSILNANNTFKFNVKNISVLGIWFNTLPLNQSIMKENIWTS